ncbi:tyrosine-type recombinase/integrase [Streptomyces niveus]|uniref:tyrosine-type recombinase/integrase n=1 Tax=Streptomyces niveus TaxID=193462 RepID=UPI00340C757F
MASIVERPKKSGEITYQVKWRQDGEWESERFGDPDAAEQFKNLVEAHGGQWPHGWVRGRGFVEPDEKPGDMPFVKWATRYIDRLTGIDIHTREDYHSEVRLHFQHLVHTTTAGLSASSLRSRTWRAVASPQRMPVPMSQSARSLARRLTAGLPPEGHVFRAAMGGAWRHANWKPAVAAAVAKGLPKRPRIHDLRHTHVAWLIAANIPLPAIQIRLGHESIQTTVDRYGHLVRSLDGDITAAVEAAMSVPAPRAGMWLVAGG